VVKRVAMMEARVTNVRAANNLYDLEFAFRSSGSVHTWAAIIYSSRRYVNAKSTLTNTSRPCPWQGDGIRKIISSDKNNRA
jgi:hypothetical protein